MIRFLPFVLPLGIAAYGAAKGFFLFAVASMVTAVILMAVSGLIVSIDEYRHNPALIRKAEHMAINAFLYGIAGALSMGKAYILKHYGWSFAAALVAAIIVAAAGASFVESFFYSRKRRYGSV